MSVWTHAIGLGCPPNTLGLYQWARYQQPRLTWSEVQMADSSHLILTAYSIGRKRYVRIPAAWQREHGAKGAIRDPRHWTGPIPELEQGELGE